MSEDAVRADDQAAGHNHGRSFGGDKCELNRDQMQDRISSGRTLQTTLPVLIESYFWCCIVKAFGGVPQRLSHACSR